MVQQQLSYRETLSNKWKLRLYLEGQMKDAMDSLKKQSHDSSTQQHQQQRTIPSTTDLVKSWNKGIRYIEDFLSTKDE